MAEIEIVPDRERLTETAAEHIARLASEAIAANGMFSIALSGGSTPQPLYTLLASGRFAKRIEWSQVHVFWGDERCVPPDNPQNNYRMAREALLDAVPLPPANAHRIRGEDDPNQASSRYEEELRAFFGSNPTDGSPRTGFDLVLLGMGENGHTASLFPGSPAVTELVRWVMAQYVEAVSMWRITLTPIVINAAKNITFLVSGIEKSRRLRDVLEGPMQPRVLPAQIIKPKQGRLMWLVDKAASSCLRKVQ
jgi:6-phosphogluconolactonase